MTNSEIILEVDAKNATSIRCGASFFKIYGLPKEEYPAFPHFEEGFFGDCDLHVVSGMFRERERSCQRGRTNRRLCGLYP
ncbi:MAG: hypothetical protein ACKOEZ_00240 [Spartobacteria bacterium]